MTNLLNSFADWYIDNREGKSANYIKNQFGGKVERFKEALQEYAEEFNEVFDYNPFEIEINEIHLNQLRTDMYLKETPFELYSKSKSNHMPTAIFGKLNYLAFLNDLTHSDITPPIITTPDEKTIYTREDLYKRFTHRLITQDRCFGEVYFPISILKKLFFKQSDSRLFFESWIKTTLDTIIVQTKNGYTTLDQVKQLIITVQGQGHVEVLLSGSSTPEVLYTNRADGIEKTPLQQNLLRDIVLDHVEPMSRILASNVDKLPALKRLTDEINRLHKGHTAITSQDFKAIGNVLLELSILDNTNVPELQKELLYIQSLTRLELMDRQENSRKSDK